MIRRFTALLLALVLAVTSQSMAVARGASAATGQVVLCTGAGPVAVYTDAQGQPTSAPHICPDAAMNVLLGLNLPVGIAPWQVMQSQPGGAYHIRVVPLPVRVLPPSRGPPLAV